MKKLSLLLGLFLLLSTTTTQAQILDRVLKRTTDKLVNRAEDMVVEKASDALSRILVNKMEREIDKVLMAEYEKQDSVAEANGETPRYPNYDAFLSSMNRAADVPESYEFDLLLITEVTEGKDKPQDMVYYLDRDGEVTAFETIEKNGKKTMMLLDMKQDLSIIYTEEDGKRTAQAIPSMFSWAGAAAKQNAEENEVEYDFRATGKKKKVAGYRCEEYEITHEDGKSRCYVTTELDFSWSDAFGQMMAKMVSEKTMEQFSKMEDGMALESINYDKKNKQDSHWLTKEVKQEAFTLDNSQYQFEDFSSELEEAEEE